MNGVKQGCILSPTLFSIVMTDLVEMLNNRSQGILYRGELIPGLLYADDIILMASSDEELQAMLDTAAAFADKWSMKYNESKSKVLIVGKRTNKAKQWQLGTALIGEAEHYKYLGIYFSRSLKDTYHISSYLSDKKQKLCGHIGSVLSSHGNINRISFGDTLWRHVAMPALAHGAGVWFPSSDQSTIKLKSYQYNIGTTILQLQGKPATEALLADLGWLPLTVCLDLNRVKYFNYLKTNLSERRYLLKGIFDDLGDLYLRGKDDHFPYHRNIHNIFKSVGLDWVYDSTDGNYVQTFKKLQVQNYMNDFRTIIESRSSLKYFQHMKLNTYKAQYMHDICDFRGVQLKFKLRTGILGINENRKRWNLSDGICPVCKNNEENVYHFVFNCPAYTTFHIAMLKHIEEELLSHGMDEVFMSFMAASQPSKLNWLMGDHAYLISDFVGKTFDLASRKYLKDAWNLRVGVISIAEQ
jgi:hypothetical protein